MCLGAGSHAAPARRQVYEISAYFPLSGTHSFSMARPALCAVLSGAVLRFAVGCHAAESNRFRADESTAGRMPQENEKAGRTSKTAKRTLGGLRLHMACGGMLCVPTACQRRMSNNPVDWMATAGIEPATRALNSSRSTVELRCLALFPRVARAATSVTWNVPACH